MVGVAPVWSNTGTSHIVSASPASLGYDRVLPSVGQTISVLLVKNGTEGVKLQLPSGQTIAAQGSIPFPEMTQLQVKVSIQDGIIRLQILEATPPSPASILGPLIRGEANILIQQLQASKMPETLAPLARLFSSLVLPSELQIQQAIDALPVSTRYLLSRLIGLKDNAPINIVQSLIEHFEPIASLFEGELLDAEKQVASNVALLGNEQKAVPLAETLIKDLAYALAKLFDSSSPLLEKNLNQISNLKDMFRSEFLSILGRAINEANREPFEKNILMDIFGKIQIALKQLPEDLRNNVSKLFVGSVVEDTNVIAKAIFGEFGVDGNNLAKGFGKDFFQEANNKFASTKLLQILENMPISIKKEIAFALSGSQGAKPGDIAELLINKINGSNIGVDFSPKLELTSPSIRQIITIMLEVARPIINRHFSDLSSTAGDGSLVVNERMVSQKLTQVIENMPISIRKDTAAVVLGNSEAGAKDISENIYHRAVGSASSNIEKGVFQNTQPEIRQIITLLHELAMSFQLEGDRLLGVTAEVNNGGQITASDFQKVVQAIENLPASIRRAIALAIFNSPETKPIDIATFIINQGANANIDKNLVSLLESTPPLVRQLVTVISQLPIGSTPQQIAESVLNGERGIFLAAKGILSVDAGVEKSNLSDLSGLGSVLNNDDASRNNSTESTSGLSNSNINEKLLSITFADRISYLLRFEHFNSQQTFSMGEKNDISSWFRSIVDQLILTKSTKMQYQEVADSFKQNRESLRIDRNTNSIVGQAANKTIEPPLDKPQTWQAWLKGSMKALVDQSISPKDALFHTIVAREGVNYFQLPLPWLSNRSMEMWIEEEEANEAENKNPSTFRMLLAVNFSILGETRIGMESSGKRLAVKIWTESPHLIEKELPNLQSGIAALGFDVHASIQTLGSDKEGVIPSIKSIIMGSSLHAMG